MTVAGVCGLLIASMGLDKSEQELDATTGVAAQCGVYAENAAIAKGMNWIGSHFNFESPKSSFYNVYGIERLGRLSGQRFIDKYDWYREGCERLVRMQQIGGSSAGAITNPNRRESTPHPSSPPRSHSSSSRRGARRSRSASSPGAISRTPAMERSSRCRPGTDRAR